MQRLLLEALAGAIASQASHTIPAVSGPVSSLALHYGLDWAGDEAYKKLKKRPRLRKAYDKAFRSRNPKGRPGRFVADLSSLGATAAGVHAADKLFKGATTKKALLTKLAMGVGGHALGRYAGNIAGHKVNRALFRKRRK